MFYGQFISQHLHNSTLLALGAPFSASCIGRSIIRLYNPTNGRITFNGKVISGVLDRDTRSMLRSDMQMIFQDPMASLNPRKKVGDIISEGMDIHHRFANRQEREEKISEMLKKVGLSPEHAARYPHQFSGGQRQRVGITRALIMNPKLIIADECISALDVSIQAQVVNLMKDIQAETQCAYLFIAHDLSMVKYISDRIGVLHLGYMVESGTKEEIFFHPLHPYTKSLLSAIPHPNPVVEKHRVALTYNYATSGIGYAQGTEHSVGGTHTPCLRRMKSLTHGRNNVLSPEHAILTLQKQQQRRLSPLLLF